MPDLKLAVLGSTNGSTFQKLLPLMQASGLPVRVNLVLSDRPDAGILKFAASENLPFCLVEGQGQRGKLYDERLKIALMDHSIDLILLIGFMRIIGQELIEQWPMLNVHPSLLPRHAGLMDLAVHQAVIDSKDQTTGCTVHYVTAAVDEGPIAFQSDCQVEDHDTAESLKHKVQQLEAPALLSAIRRHLEDHHDARR